MVSFCGGYAATVLLPEAITPHSDTSSSRHDQFMSSSVAEMLHLPNVFYTPWTEHRYHLKAISMYWFSSYSSSNFVALPVIFWCWRLTGNAMIYYFITWRLSISLSIIWLLSFRYSTCLAKKLSHVSFWIKSAVGRETFSLSLLFFFTISSNFQFRCLMYLLLINYFQKTGLDTKTDFLWVPRFRPGSVLDRADMSNPRRSLLPCCLPCARPPELVRKGVISYDKLRSADVAYSCVQPAPSYAVASLSEDQCVPFVMFLLDILQWRSVAVLIAAHWSSNKNCFEVLDGRLEKPIHYQ